MGRLRCGRWKSYWQNSFVAIAPHHADLRGLFSADIRGFNICGNPRSFYYSDPLGRPINKHCLAQNIFTGHKSPIPAIL